MSLPLLFPCTLFYLNCLAQMLFLSLPTPLPLTSPSSPIKGKKKIRSDYSSLKEKCITGRGEPSLVLMYTSWTQTELRALAKEFPNPSQDPLLSPPPPLGFAKESDLTI